MKIIIIGSKGFIGQNLFSHFASNGHEVWGADIAGGIAGLTNYFHLDSNDSDFNTVFRHTSFNLCINCSGAASVPDSIKNPIRDYYLNTVNVFKILEAIKINQPGCRFINLSSAAVYGNPRHLPVKENAELIPLSPYGIHKLQAEQICKEFYDFFKIQTCSLRVFSVYGNGLQKQLFWDLFIKAKSGLPFTLFGTGNESRDYIHIKDLAIAIDLISEYSDFKADIINVANGNEVLIKDAVQVFFSSFKGEIRYTFSGDTRKGDPANWMADIGKLNSFGYQPSVDINTGLKEYFEWAETIRFN